MLNFGRLPYDITTRSSLASCELNQDMISEKVNSLSSQEAIKMLFDMFFCVV